MKRFSYYSIFFVLFFGCMNRHKIQSRTSPFDLQGHRGCRGLMPENTIPAMIKAVQLGVTTLEMDAVITKDHKVILSHEPFFNHEITTKADGSYVTEAEEKSLNIYTMDYEEIRKYDVGLKPHPRFSQQQKLKVAKPLLSDVIDSVESYCRQHNLTPPYYNIETKCQPSTDNLYHPAPSVFVDLLLEIISAKQIERQAIIQSFDFRTLKYLHAKYPRTQTAMLIEDFDKRTMEEQIKETGFTPTIYSPAYLLVDEKLVKECRQRGIKLIPWTVNDKPTMEKLKTLGVDGLITDYPNLFQ